MTKNDPTRHIGFSFLRSPIFVAVLVTPNLFPQMKILSAWDLSPSSDNSGRTVAVPEPFSSCKLSDNHSYYSVTLQIAVLAITLQLNCS